MSISNPETISDVKDNPLDLLAWQARGDWHEEQDQLEQAALWRTRASFGKVVLDRFAAMETARTWQQNATLDRDWACYFVATGLTWAKVELYNCGLEEAGRDYEESFRCKRIASDAARRKLIFALVESAERVARILVGWPAEELVSWQADPVHEGKHVELMNALAWWMTIQKVPNARPPVRLSVPALENRMIWVIPFGAASFLHVHVSGTMNFRATGLICSDHLPTSPLSCVGWRERLRPGAVIDQRLSTVDVGRLSCLSLYDAIIDCLHGELLDGKFLGVPWMRMNNLPRKLYGQPELQYGPWAKYPE